MVTVILVHGLDDSIVDKVIQQFSDGPYSHSAILFDNGLGVVESLGIKDEHDPYPGVWSHNPHTYDDAVAKKITILLPNQELAEEETRNLLGSLYGYTDCVKGGLYDLLKIKLPGNTLSINCSEFVTRVLRAGGLNVMPDVEPDCVTPNDLFRWFEDGGYIE